MTPEQIEPLQAIAATNRWWALWPEILLGLLSLVILVLDGFFPKLRTYTPHLILAALAGLFAAVILVGVGEATTLFGGLIYHSDALLFTRTFFLASAFCVTALAMTWFQRHPDLGRSEFYHILLVVTAASMLLTQADHFVLIFVALETVTIGFYALVAYARSRSETLEAGLKYLVFGALSSAILLFGIVLVYGAATNSALASAATDGFSFAQLAPFVEANAKNPLLITGVGMIIVGLAFKIGAFPFQIWIPDVYQGAPTPTTALLAVGSKAAGVIVLVLLVQGPFEALSWLLVPLISALAVGSLLFANLAAIPQKDTKRIMGLSGVSHAGFLLMGVAAIPYVDWAIFGVFFYLAVYLVASFLVFQVMTLVARDDDVFQPLGQYRLLLRDRPLLGAGLIVGLGSLAGIPPLAGFMGKAMIFIAAYQAGHYVLLGVGLLAVVLSIFYYFGWMVQATSGITDEPEATDPTPVPGFNWMRSAFILGLITLTVIFGFYPAPLL